MGILFLLIFLFVSVCIVGLVLLQEGKGGGLTGMSTGMDGVMGARNPLRRWTAYLFVVFVFLCLAINMYFHNREDASLPTGLKLNSAQSAIEEAARQAASATTPEGSLRPDVEAVGEAAAKAAEAAASGE